MAELRRVVRDTEAVAPAVYWLRVMLERGLPAGPVELCIRRPRRSLDQNAKLWAVLSDVSAQVDWHGQRLSKEEWKDVMTAALKRQKVVPGIDGGFVVLGTSTSKMDKQEFGELLELIQAFGAEHGVEWGDTAAEVYQSYREAQA